MRFIIESGFTCLPGKTVQMQEWLAANEEKIATSAPDGCRYLGTFVAIYTSEKAAGDYRQLWEVDSYGAQDAFAAAMKEGGTFAVLMDEFARSFVDPDPKANWSNGLLRRVTDAAIWGE